MATEPDLVHCIYASSATRPFSFDQLVELLAVARRNNAALGVTGMLLHDRGSFFQVLEGRAATVDALYARIAADARHAEIVRIIHEPVARRSFGQWSMGFVQVDDELLRSVEGANDFFRGGTALSAIDSGRARKLLQAFGAGRWHRRDGAA